MSNGIKGVCDQYCVFRADEAMYAVSAEMVREVADLVPIVPVPEAPPALVGMCHLRTDFIPVLGVNSLIGATASPLGAAAYLLIFRSEDGPWALLIQRALSLELLEVGYADTEIDCDNASRMTLGTATYRDNVVRVLDAGRMYRVAAEILEAQWSSLRVAGPDAESDAVSSCLLPV